MAIRAAKVHGCPKKKTENPSLMVRCFYQEYILPTEDSLCPIIAHCFHIYWQNYHDIILKLSLKQYNADRYIKKLTTWNQFTALLYAQITGLESLREIENAFMVQNLRTYHLGLPSKICRNTLSNANAKRDWRIYEGMFYKLMDKCRNLTPKHKFKFSNPLYSIDSTIINLCLSVFPWSEIKHKKGAIKMHFQYDHSGDIPCFMIMTQGNKNDVVTAKAHFKPSRDSIYCFDRAYLDYHWFRRISDAKGYFITRMKKKLSYRIVGQHESFKGPSRGVLSDDVIELSGRDGKRAYSRQMRLIQYHDKELNKTFEFITNHLKLSARTIADIYKITVANRNLFSDG